MSAALPKRLSAEYELIVDERAAVRADCNPESKGCAAGRALAAELVRRWNAHAALVAALEKTTPMLERALGALNEEHSGDYGWDEDELAVLEQARAALATARQP